MEDAIVQFIISGSRRPWSLVCRGVGGRCDRLMLPDQAIEQAAAAAGRAAAVAALAEADEDARAGGGATFGTFLYRLSIVEI